jgi:metal-dependent hydrolase (beta-lactamase superfamily II)
MPRTITITVLADNTVARRGLLAEHGLAFWVETGDRRLLFDTGQGLVLTANASALGIDLRTVDTVVLSHIRDLTGGTPLRAVLGGLHLRAASPERLAWALAALPRFSMVTLCPMHCTGAGATAALWAAFPDHCVPGAVGTTWTF